MFKILFILTILFELNSITQSTPSQDEKILKAKLAMMKNIYKANNLGDLAKFGVQIGKLEIYSKLLMV